MPEAHPGLKIAVERPDPQQLKALGVSRWPIWTKEVSRFEWYYEEPEACYPAMGATPPRRGGAGGGMSPWRGAPKVPPRLGGVGLHFLDGEVTVETAEGQVSIRQGDFVRFPKGLRCGWQVTKPVRKHYRFGALA